MFSFLEMLAILRRFPHHLYIVFFWVLHSISALLALLGVSYFAALCQQSALIGDIGRLARLCHKKVTTPNGYFSVVGHIEAIRSELPHGGRAYSKYRPAKEATRQSKQNLSEIKTNF